MSFLNKHKDETKIGQKLLKAATERHQPRSGNCMATREEYEKYLARHDPRIFTSRDGEGERLEDFDDE